jgi:hypothetical protein
MQKLLIAPLRNRTPEPTHRRIDIRSAKYPKASRDVPPDECWVLSRSPAEKLVSARSVTGGPTTTPHGQLQLVALFSASAMVTPFFPVKWPAVIGQSAPST